MPSSLGKTDSDRAKIVEMLVTARVSGVSPALAELDGELEDALELQVEIQKALEQRGQRKSGWKLGLTSGIAHDMMGVGFRPFGYILAERTLRSGDTLRAGPKIGPQIEPELCLRMKAPLRGADIPPDECRAAVAEVCAAFEINEPRVAYKGQHRLFIADGLANWGLVVGDGAPPRDGLAATKVDLYVGDDLKETSPGDLVMDDPFVSLSRLCTRLARYGLGVDAGQYVITGAFLRHPITDPGRYRAHFSGIGDVTLNVA